MKLRRIDPSKLLQHRPVRDYLMITFGVVLVAFGLDAFLIPNKLAAGGVSGLATVIYYTAKDAFGINLPVGIQMLIMNVFLLALAIRLRGWRYGARTIYGAVALSLAVDLLAWVPNLAPHDRLLAVLYGGAISGIGLGLVFRSAANTGGTDIIAQLLAPKVPLGTGQLLLAADAIVTLAAAFKFGPALALYGLLAVFVSGTTIDVVLEGFSVEKAAFIISDASDRVAEGILHELKRGATGIAARGLYSGQEKEMIFTVVSRNEIAALKEIVNAADPGALLVISDVHEAIGEGFKEIGR